MDGGKGQLAAVRRAFEEADLEGMAVADGYLWVVGSHGLKRKNIKPDRGHADNAKRLAKVTLDANQIGRASCRERVSSPV